MTSKKTGKSMITSEKGKQEMGSNKKGVKKGDVKSNCLEKKNRGVVTKLTKRLINIEETYCKKKNGEELECASRCALRVGGFQKRGGGEKITRGPNMQIITQKIGMQGGPFRRDNWFQRNEKRLRKTGVNGWKGKPSRVEKKH